jgi:hypothetical protein
MTKANPIAMRATCTALPLLLAGILSSAPAAAEPEGSEAPAAQPQPQPQSKAQPLPQAQPLPPPPRPLPSPLYQPQQPPWPPQAQPMPRLPGQAQPMPRLPGQELAWPQKPPPSEPEGPVWSWDPLRFAFGLETRTFWPLDDAHKRLVGKRAPTATGLGVQADVFRPDAKTAIRLDLGWTSVSTSQLQSGTGLVESLDTDLYVLGASLRYELFRWLGPYARLAGGLGRDKLSVADMKAKRYFGQATAGAGVFLRTPGLRLWQGSFAPSFGLCGQIEGGYALASGSDLSLRASSPSSTPDPIPASDVAIGHAGRSAPYLRISFGLAF